MPTSFNFGGAGNSGIRSYKRNSITKGEQVILHENGTALYSLKKVKLYHVPGFIRLFATAASRTENSPARINFPKKKGGLWRIISTSIDHLLSFVFITEGFGTAPSHM